VTTAKENLRAVVVLLRERDERIEQHLNGLAIKQGIKDGRNLSSLEGLSPRNLSYIIRSDPYIVGEWASIV
jgi:hypothetical protein